MKTLIIIVLTFGFSFHLSAQWFPLSSNTTSHLRSVHFSDKNNGWIAGLDNFLNKTSDGGEIWENTSFHGSSKSAWYSIYMINSDEIYACGNVNNYIYQENYAFTYNAGDSWEWQTSWGSQGGVWIHVFFLNDNYGWKVGYRGAGRLSKTTTGINGFSYKISFDQNPRTVYFIDQNTGWVAGRNGYITKSTDGGESWNELTSGVSSYLQSIFFINSSVGWAVGHDDEDIGIIIKTTDGGESWHQVNHPQTFSLHSIQFVNENIGWACGSKVENLEERGVILYTNDGGENWSEQYVCDKLSTLYSLFFIDEFTGWAVGYDGIIVKTTNAGGTSYEGIDEDLSFNRSLNIHPNPFSTSTTIEYELKQPEKVTLTIYDYLGKQLEVIIENQSQGLQKVSWNAERLPVGIYYFRLQAGEQVVNGKMVKAR